MTYCEYCGEEIGYLPFKCKYCQGNFCQLHRLPENHDCTFEIKHPFRLEEPKIGAKKEILTKRKKSHDVSRYIKREEKVAGINKQKVYNLSKRIDGPKTLIILILVVSIIASILKIFSYDIYILFSLSGLFSNFSFYTIITSLFITVISIDSPFILIEIIFLIIMLYFTYLLSKSIDFRYGTKFLFKLYIISTLFSLFLYIPLRLTLIAIAPIPSYYFPIGFAWGGILGLISYTLFPAMSREITALMTFIPVRLRARTFLYIIIFFRIIPILFYPIYFVFYLPELGGILGAYMLYKKQFKIN